MAFKFGNAFFLMLATVFIAMPNVCVAAPADNKAARASAESLISSKKKFDDFKAKISDKNLNCNDYCNSSTISCTECWSALHPVCVSLQSQCHAQCPGVFFVQQCLQVCRENGCTSSNNSATCAALVGVCGEENCICY